MILQLALLILGLVILVGGAEFLVRGAKKIALKLGIPTLVVGLTVVAFGTSAPELFVSLAAALEGNGDVAIGNVIGSNICNILLIVGITACIAPVTIPPSLNRREMPVMLGALTIFILFSLDLVITRFESSLLVLSLLLYLYLNYRVVMRGEMSLQVEIFEELEEEEEEDASIAPDGFFANFVLIVLGLAGLVGGAELIVSNAVAIAKTAGISDFVIGVTLVAIGTSLPELATTIVAAKKNEADLAVGNAVGSNIFNVLCVIGCTALVTPLNVAASALSFDMIFMILSSLLVWPIMIWKRELGRMAGVMMLVAYLGYLLFVLSSGELPV